MKLIRIKTKQNMTTDDGRALREKGKQQKLKASTQKTNVKGSPEPDHKKRKDQENSQNAKDDRQRNRTPWATFQLRSMTCLSKSKKKSSLHVVDQYRTPKVERNLTAQWGSQLASQRSNDGKGLKRVRRSNQER